MTDAYETYLADATPADLTLDAIYAWLEELTTTHPHAAHSIQRVQFAILDDNTSRLNVLLNDMITDIKAHP